MARSHFEEMAKEMGAKLAQVDTYDFQALLFYQKLGYEVFGVLDNCPIEGNKRYYLSKSFYPKISDDVKSHQI